MIGPGRAAYGNGEEESAPHGKGEDSRQFPTDPNLTKHVKNLDDFGKILNYCNSEKLYKSIKTQEF